jgi:hypothetical protein
MSTPEDRRREAEDGPAQENDLPRQRMDINNIEIGWVTKGAIMLTCALAVSILGWMASKIDATDGKVDTIRAGQVEEIKQRSERDVAILTRLSGVESEVQGLKSRTEKLEQEIRK